MKVCEKERVKTLSSPASFLKAWILRASRCAGPSRLQTVSFRSQRQRRRLPWCCKGWDAGAV